ncbi:phosphatidylglycerol lysyltransferase domain-containing protein, partial [Bifidobacterium breve]
FNNGRVIGWTLDFMRYRSGSYNGIMEFLIARMAQRMHDQGVADPSNQVQFVSLSAAPLTGLKNFTDAKSDDSSNVDGTTML